MGKKIDSVPEPKAKIQKDASKKKKKELHYRRAGLQLPSSRFKKPIRDALKGGKHMMSRDVDVALIGYVEHILTTLMTEASNHIGDSKNLRLQHVHAALKDKNWEFYGVLPERVTGLN